MEELIKSLKVAHATVFAFYLKSHFFHWNVEGPDFYQYHKLFEQIYQDVQESIDGFGEQIRTLDSYAPGSFERLGSLSKIHDETKIPTGAVMIERLLADNETLMVALTETADLATKANNQGLVNFLGARLETHAKWSYFLRSTKKD